MFPVRSLAEFNDFLRKAEEYDRTGKLTAPASSRASGSRAANGPALTVDEAVKVFNDLEARATDPVVTYPEIDAKFKPIEKLTKTGGNLVPVITW